MLGAETQPTLGGVSEDAQRREEGPDLRRGWGARIPRARKGPSSHGASHPRLTCPRCPQEPLRHPSQVFMEAAEDLVKFLEMLRRGSGGGHGAGRARAAATEILGTGPAPIPAVSHPVPQASRRPPPPPPGTRRFRGRGGVLPSRNAHPLHTVTEGEAGAKA